MPPRRNIRNIRERNERGLISFLRNLQSVLRIILIDDFSSISEDDLTDVKERLTDASATLTLLIGDLSSGLEVGGLPNSESEKVVELKNNLVRIVTYIDSCLEEESTAEIHTAYCAPSIRGQGTTGRPLLSVTKGQLEHLRSLHFPWKKISEILHVSISTINRRRLEFGMEDENYSSISDEDLDFIYRSLSSRDGGNLLTPNLGRRRFLGSLRSRGLRVQRWRISDSIRRVDPVGAALRWRLVTHRRKYFVPTPNSLWHIDSAHKLIRWKFIVHVCIDGKTRVIVYCVCSNNNKAETVCSLFQDGVARWGLPSRVRSDYGMENYHVGVYMIEARGTGRGSIITGSSVHNSRVERTHRDVYSGVLVFYSKLFEQMEQEGFLDPLQESHLFCLHHVFLPRINQSLDEFVAQMNNRPLSTERNQSPLQLWEQGMLENINSAHEAVEDLESYGIDPESVPSVHDDDYQVAVDPPELHLSEEEMALLPDPLLDDNCFGVGTYLQCTNLFNL